MSRRAPNPAAERAAQNTQTIKSLLKLEGNKTCSDCKRNKHPRWASWNLGIFICIRCSGIHRGMGTHISRVKSVDLDAWTDEQLQSVLKWGNSRANKYWEAKLAPGHVPSESKIENFIRTKYESKRWVMEGPIPDPATLDADGDDDVPLSLVKEKQAIERSNSQRASAGQAGPAQVKRAQQPDLFADDAAVPRASSAAVVPGGPPPKSEPAPPKQTKPADSLLGLDFFGTEALPPSRPSSAAPTPGTPSRPDLKQSILSLYASAPRPQSQQQPSHVTQGSFGGLQSAPQSPPAVQSSFGVMNDAFSGLSFSSQNSPLQVPPKQSAFSGLGNVSGHARVPSQVSSSQTNLSGGSFFDPKPRVSTQSNQGSSSSSGFGAYDSAPGTSSVPKIRSGMDDLFDFSTPAQHAAKPMAASAAQSPSMFNLSQPAPAPPPKTQPPQLPGAWGNSDAWGSDDAWGSTTKTSAAVSNPTQANSNNIGWGSGNASLGNQNTVVIGGGGFGAGSTTQPKVSADDDFGGWSSAAPTATGAGTTVAKPAYGASEDLFSNVWE
ncbi:unnamed protein product [Diplocarpon coronariae]|uniref:Stromal membrane-associated protein n=1 Tax=Diplocarpon coronariae TaxID=2795749 RepID=A0A218ZGZ3_9HELO|nr:hypothetical protein JHW43_002296 [Diplocarpon mali]OWP07319.1 stromal membrane-associated protein [Marssonina coronariae]